MAFTQSYETTSAGLHTGRDVDVCDLLPPSAADKVIKLRQHADDLHVQIPEFETRLEVSQKKTAHDSRIAQLMRPKTQGGFALDADAPQVVAEQRLADKAKAEVQRIDELIEIRTAKWRGGIRILQTVDEFFIAGGVPSNCVVEEVAPKLAKNGNLIETIERERHRIRELRADAHRVASCPYPSSHTKRKMREAIEALAMRGTPSVSRLVELNGEIDFADLQHRIPVITDKDAGIATLIETDALGLIAWLFKPALIAALDNEIADESDDKIALSEQQRAEQVAQIERDIVERERIESELIWTAWQQGTAVEHRTDAQRARAARLEADHRATRRSVGDIAGACHLGARMKTRDARCWLFRCHDGRRTAQREGGFDPLALAHPFHRIASPLLHGVDTAARGMGAATTIGGSRRLPSRSISEPRPLVLPEDDGAQGDGAASHRRIVARTALTGPTPSRLWREGGGIRGRMLGVPALFI
jgi:hypothetical protein